MDSSDEEIIDNDIDDDEIENKVSEAKTLTPYSLYFQGILKVL